ncbi:hypothetical protein PWYN_23910 [Paenibacillus wynnii]|uniref:Uncharacterized protein n=1 Tax=Paenibacillus wynnii TaxID=268407 RepID=A0A098M4Z3_9BACL|nr:hypothetical protein PWYN_23910 [Paenibacillus wynnii]
MLVRTLRERTVAPIAVLSRFYLFSLAVKIRRQLMLSKLVFLRKTFGRPLPLFRNRSVLSATFSGNHSKIYSKKSKKKPLFGRMEVRPTISKGEVSLYI